MIHTTLKNPHAQKYFRPFLNKIILITGPTASGKTSIAIELSERIQNSEILSVDSRQFYRGMDIGTAKPTLEEQARVPHHFIDIADPSRGINAGEYARRAREIIRGLHQRNAVPILVGGSGMYWKAVIDGFYEEEADYGEIRSDLQDRLHSEGLEALYRQLSVVDPISHFRIKPNDTQRILRALEVGLSEEELLVEKWQRGRGNAPQYEAVMIWVDRERDRLYAAIDARVDKMAEMGLLEEVKKLVGRGLGADHFVMGSMGYEEPLRYLKGELSWDEAVSEIKKNSRQFAKRQTTWFRRDRRLRRLDPDIWGIEGVCERIIAQFEK